MDAWDVLSAVVRRWYLVLAVLLVGGVTAAVVANQLPPSYQATDAQLLVGPPDKQAAELNPLASGPTAAGVISVLSRGPEFRQAIADGDGAPDFKVSASDQSGLVGLQAEGLEREQAVLTLSLLADEVRNGLVRAQDDLGVPEASRLRLVPVASTPEVTESSGTARTAATALLALSVVGAVVLAVGADSWARRRHRGSDDYGAPATKQDRRTADSDRLQAVEASLDSVRAGLVRVSAARDAQRSGVSHGGAPDEAADPGSRGLAHHSEGTGDSSASGAVDRVGVEP